GVENGQGRAAAVTAAERQRRGDEAGGMAERTAEDSRREGACLVAAAGGQPQRLACPSHVSHRHGTFLLRLVGCGRLLHRMVFRRSFRHFPVFSGWVAAAVRPGGLGTKGRWTQGSRLPRRSRTTWR